MDHFFSGWKPLYETAHIGWYIAFGVYWGSYPLVLGLCWLAWRRLRRWAEVGWLRRIGTLLFVAFIGVYVDARFIEPARITVQFSKLDLGVPARIAVVSDLHLGVFNGPDYLKRVLDELNKLDVDAVLIAGDHNYKPNRPLEELMAPWLRCRHPVYSVPGNHDEEHPGPPLENELRGALQKAGVHTIEYHYANLGAFYLVGIGDHFASRDGMGPLGATPTDKPRVLLFHNPATIWHVPKGLAVLALAGHTHGGQIRLPYITHRMVGMFDHGLYTNTPVPMFVTSGLGESHLPLRLGIPPVIDVLDLN